MTPEARSSHRPARGRFAPSPSGRMHLGNGLSALISWLDTRHLGGEMIFRLEDLDPQRSRVSFAQLIADDLRWLGLDWDEGPDVGGPFGPYIQSQRRELYEAQLQALVAKGLVYPCVCTRSELHDASAPHASDGELIYAGTCRHRTPEALSAALRSMPNRQPAMRLQVTETPITFVDLHDGPQSQQLNLISGDFILRRSDGVHAYQLAVSVDDALMGINRVVRGEDLLSSVGRQIYLHQLMGFDPPVYGHVPLMVGTDGKRLSKRHFATDFGYWRDQGVKPEEIVGYLAFKAGISDRYQALSAQSLISSFSWDKIVRGPIVVSETELFACIQKP